MSRRNIYYNASFASAVPVTDFISTWDTTKAGSASDTIVLPMTAGVATVDWGDGTINTSNTHTYITGGIYTLIISGTIEGFRFAGGGDRRKIIDISNWGTFTVTTNKAFRECSNLDISATDAPTLASTNALFEMFWGCTSLTTVDFTAWDITPVTDASGCFRGCVNMNANVSTWDISNLQYIGINQNFRGMFEDCSIHEGDVSNWNPASVLRADKFAFNAFLWNPDVTNWVIPPTWFSVNKMFQNSSMDRDLSGWNISSFTIMNNFLNGGEMSTANYDATLISWAAQSPSTANSPHFGTSKYTLGGAAEAARTSLISTYGWTISDGGGV